MTAAAIFVKTPGLSPIKTRLAAELGSRKAEKFHLLSAHWTAHTLTEVSEEVPLTIYWAVAEAEGIEAQEWEHLPRVFQGKGGLGDRLATVYSSLLPKHQQVLLLGADSPELNPRVIVDAIKLLEDDEGGIDFVMGETPDGGFYLFGGKTPIDRSQWNAVPYSTDQTARKLRQSLAPLGKLNLVAPCHDIDTMKDFLELNERLKVADPKKYASLNTLMR